MMQTILGAENYRKGTDLYFKRHDGDAATCEDFVKAMEDASDIDLSHFKLWYSQAGTPEVHFTGTYNEADSTYMVEMAQSIPDTPGQSGKKPMHIPVSIGLLNNNGDEMRTETLHLTEAKQSFVLENIPSKPVPSVLRNFSAPVKLKTQLSDDALKFLMVHDQDGFNKWEAGQNYFLLTINKLIEHSPPSLRSPLPLAGGLGGEAPADFLETYSGLLDRALDPQSDKALMARALSLPDIPRIAQEQDIVDPQAIFEAREKVLNSIVDNFSDKLGEIYTANRTGPDFSITPEAMGQRALQNTIMLILSNKRSDEDAQRCKAHYESANNMTDRMAALYLACALDGPVGEDIVADFHERFKNYPLVVDKWFAAQAQIHLPKTIQIIKKLKQHPDFNIKNPNRVRSLYAAFAMNNPVRFHAADGSGYNFLTDAVIELNELNPQIAARLLTPMKDWQRYTQDRQELMKASLNKILEQRNLSNDVFEIVSKTLKG